LDHEIIFCQFFLKPWGWNFDLKIFNTEFVSNHCDIQSHFFSASLVLKKLLKLIAFKINELPT